MEEYLRLAILGAMLVPLSVRDWQERAVSADLVISLACVSVILIAYDAAMGEYDMMELPRILQVSGFAFAGMMFVLSRKGLVAWADVVIMLAIFATMPVLHGRPAGFDVILWGLGAGVAYSCAYSAYHNVTDWLAGRPYSASIICCHKKRPGEKFCTDIGSGRKGIGAVGDDGHVRAADGTMYHAGVDDQGGDVRVSIPMAAMLAVGVCIVSAWIMLADAYGGGFQSIFDMISP